MGVLSSIWHAILSQFYQRFYRLKIQDFEASLLPRVQGFYCGDEVWSKAVAAYIQNGEAIADMSNPKRRTQVWLYWLSDNLIGYGSMGLTQRPLPPGTRPFVKCAIIPFVGIQFQYRRKPKWADDDDRFSGQVINHLVGKAKATGRPLLILYVHVENKGAIRLYEKFGFDHTGYIEDEHELMTLRIA